MANDDLPRLIPLNTGNKGTVEAHYYQVSTAEDLYIGTPLYLGSDGILEVSKLGTAGYSRCIGVAVSYIVGDSAGVNRGADLHTPPTTSSDPFLDVSDLPGGGRTAYALVADDPAQEYLAQLDTGGTALTQVGFGAISRLTYNSTSTGNTTTGFANIEVDQSILVQTSGAGVAVQLLRPHDSLNTDGTRNEIESNFGKVIVRIALHQKNEPMRAGALGI